MKELRTATDLALRATKVTARSLGQVMSTCVVQEHHLWLNRSGRGLLPTGLGRPEAD